MGSDDDDVDDGDGEEVDMDRLSLEAKNAATTTAGDKGDGDFLKKDDYSDGTAGGGGDDNDDDSYNDSDGDDPGTSWFSEYKAPQKVLHFLTSKNFPLAPCNTKPASSSSSSSSFPPVAQLPTILDLGTGNGSMLALLRDKGGFRGHMVGVDYSSQSVQLARELQRRKIFSCSDHSDDEGREGGDESWSNPDADSLPKLGEDESSAVSTPDIRFEVWDILATGPAFTEDELQRDPTKIRLDWFPYERGGFDIVMDKGTFDAVSLSDEGLPDEQKGSSGNVGEEERVKQDRKGIASHHRRICETYPSIAMKLVREGGFLVVTSCNWTEDEVIRWFTGTDTVNGSDKSNTKDSLYVWGRVEYPRFQFGGQEGQGVCTVCFRRKAREE